MQTLNAHPTSERLLLFGRGRLSDGEAAAVADHVSTCPACAGELDRLPSDPFLAALRGARGAVDAPTPYHDDRATLPGPLAAGEAGALPPELQAHARYRVGELLGCGGMGAVYRAEHALMERPVALKVIAPRLLEQPGAGERFKQEVKAAARLQHPNIVTAFDAEQVGPVMVLVMEFVEGRTLGDVLRDGGPVPMATACDCARQAALGLAHAHEHGMVHRDVKPHNLMLTPDGRVKILDFGIARFVAEAAFEPDPVPHAPAPGALTHTGACMGTLDYMAPEQAEDARAADARSDVYALCATLYHLLAGRVPFVGGSAAEKLARLRGDAPVPLASVRPGLPPGLVAVVGRMMAKRPDVRYGSAAEVAAALEPFTTPRPALRRPGWWRALFAVALLALLGGVAAGVSKFVTDRGEVSLATDDPDVELVVKGERIVRIRDPRSGRAYLCDRAELTLTQIEGDGIRVTLDGTKSVVLQRTGPKAVAVRAVPALVPVPGAAPTLVVPVGCLVEERVFEGQMRPWAFPAAITPDGRLAVTGAYNPNGVQDVLRLWRLDTGELVRTFDTKKDRVGALSFAPTGDLLASGEKALWVWNPAGGDEPRRMLNGPRPRGEGFGPVTGFSANGRRAVAADDADFSLRVWDLGAGSVLRTLRGHTAEIVCVGVSPDGKRAVSGGRDKTVRLWDLETGTELKRFDSLRDVCAVQFGPDGRTIAFGGGDGTVCLCDPARSWEVRRLCFNPNASEWFSVRGLSFTPDGTRLLVSEENTGELVLMDVPSGRVLDRVATAPITQLVVSSDGQRFVTTHYDGDARVWRIDARPPDPAAPRPGRPQVSGEVRQFVGHVGAVGAADISPDGRRVVSGGADGTARLWDASTGKELARFPEKTGRVRSVAFSRDGRRALVCGLQVVFVWDLDANKTAQRLTHPGFVHCAVLSPNGKEVLTGDGDGRTGIVRVWDVETGRELRRLTGHTGAVAALAFSPDGTRALSASHDQTVRLWDVGAGSQIHCMTGHTEWIEAVAFSPDGRRGLTAGRDYLALVWDLESGKQEYAFKSPSVGLVSATFLPDGRRAVVGGAEDGLLWVLDTEKRTVVSQHRNRAGVNWSLVPLPDGRQMLTANDDGTVRLFRLPEPGAPGTAPQPVVPFGLVLPAIKLNFTPRPEVPPAPDGPTIPRVSATTRFPVFHPDGRHLLTPDGNDVTVWDVVSREKVKTFRGLTDRVMAVRLTAGGNTAVALSNGKRVMAWDWTTGKPVGEFHAPSMPEPIALCVFPDGKRVALPAEPGFVSVRELLAGKEVARIDLNDRSEWVCTLAPSPDGRWLAVIGKQGRTHLWDTTVGKVATVLPGVPLSMNHAVGGFSPDGKFLGVGASAALRVWPVGDWTVKPTVVATDASGLVEFASTGTVVSAPVQPFNRVVTVSRWDLTSGTPTCRAEFLLAQSWNHCGLSPDGHTLAVDVEARRAFVLMPMSGRPHVAPMPRAVATP